MLNIPLHALAYVQTLKYYHVSWLSTPTPGGGTKKQPHQDPEVQEGRKFSNNLFIIISTYGLCSFQFSTYGLYSQFISIYSKL
jgi:hypothetical protein